MSKRDLVTGIWESTLFSRNGVEYVKSYINMKGYDPITETRRANSIWGDVENIRKSKGGHTKADVYSGSDFLGTMTLHKKIDITQDYSYLDGTLKLNTRNGRLTMWDEDLGNHWIAKVAYDI